MKKIIIATLFVVVGVIAKAQYKYILEDVIISSITVKEGQNSVLTKHGKGTLQFSKTGDRFSNIVFKDSLGKSHALSSIPANTPGAPKPECRSSTLNACFASADKLFGVCICKPDGKTDEYIMTFMTINGADRYSIKNFRMGQ
ncbi:MAG TPA: hypothetical protein VHM26_18760 [Chitinophagaceae bacterium]|jgi:hypothetical protein|nr:hypothetical protein [Chitinophagaceae bacterium]